MPGSCSEREDAAEVASGDCRRMGWHRISRIWDSNQELQLGRNKRQYGVSRLRGVDPCVRKVICSHLGSRISPASRIIIGGGFTRIVPAIGKEGAAVARRGREEKNRTAVDKYFEASPPSEPFPFFDGVDLVWRTTDSAGLILHTPHPPKTDRKACVELQPGPGNPALAPDEDRPRATRHC